MKNLFALVLILFTMLSYSQKIRIETSELPMGKNLLTNEVIHGTQYSFPLRIYQHHIDTISGYLTAQLRKTSSNGLYYKDNGYIFQYDLLNKEFLWRKKMFYPTSSLQQYSNQMIYSTGNASFCLDIHTGDKLWRVSKVLYYADPINNVGLGYSREQTSNKLKGFSLKDGDNLWKRKIDRSYAWNDFFYIDDSTLLIVAAGLHTVNLNTGLGWDYEAITGDKDYTAAAVTSAVGILAGVLTGTFVVSTGYDLVRDIVSNVLRDEGDLYFASKHKIARIDKSTGHSKWEYHFSDDLLSKSYIFSDDSLIYMVNWGVARRGNKPIIYGKPFIAALYKETGDLKFLTIVNSVDEEILNYQVNENELVLVLDKRVLKYSIYSGELIMEKNSSDKSDNYRGFLARNMYTQTKGNKYISLTDSDTTAMFLYNDKDETIVIDHMLNQKKIIEYDSLYIFYLATENHKFIASNGKTKVINNDGEMVAELNVSREGTLIGNTLYDRKGESFMSVDISEIIGKDDK